MIYIIEAINIDPIFQSMCKQSYYNHPRGCPNYNKKKGCPPKQKLLFDIFYRDLYLIYTEFDLKSHVNKLRKIHPNWTERQLHCCLYWQGKVRKYLNKEIELFKANMPKHKVTDCPEAMGVNVTDLMLDNAGISLEWPPKITVYKVAVAGIPNTMAKQWG